MDITIQVRNINEYTWDLPLPEVPEPSCDDSECWDWQEELDGLFQCGFENLTSDNDLTVYPSNYTIDSGKHEMEYTNMFKEVLTKWFDDERERLFKRLSTAKEDEPILKALVELADDVRHNIGEWSLQTDLCHDYEENEVEYA